MKSTFISTRISRSRRRLAIPLVLLFCTAVSIQTVAAADPFYERLLLQGIDSLNRADYVHAQKYLRRAIFGFLEEPERLAQGLTLLALAQAAAKDVEQFRGTFLRVMEIEDRFQAYARADISPENRRRFEHLVLESVPPGTLQTSPRFARLLDQQFESRLAGLSSPDQRRELERLERVQPEELRWSVQLAWLDLDEDQREEALRRASRVIASRPTHAEARLIRGLAYAASKRWKPAIEDLRASELAAGDARGAQALLGAYVAEQQWAAAADFLRELPEDIRSSPTIAANARWIEARVSSASAQRQEDGGGSEPPAPETASPSPKRPELTSSEEEYLRWARMLLDGARARDELERAYGYAKLVASRKPGSVEAQELAGEAAYRLGRWEAAVDHITRGGSAQPERPALGFYMAVSLYELGRIEEAKGVLSRSLPGLTRTPFVNQYVAKILGVSSPLSSQR